jgi:hypothetical protein
MPAAGYWVVMAGLTYVFAHLGPHPLDAAFASEPTPPSLTPPTPVPELPAEPQPPEPATEPAPHTEPAPVATTPPLAEPEPEPERLAAPAPPRVEREASPEAPSERVVRQDSAARVQSFPEFTDSTRARAREHAADGPRLDSLFERSSASADVEPGPAPPLASEPNAPVAVSSCEAAIARNNEQLEIGVRRGPADITREAYASILQNGSYLSGCRIPERTVFEVCAAVKNGHAVGITVSSSPASAPLNACVRRAVSRLRFPQNERLDVTHTRFDAAVR